MTRYVTDDPERYRIHRLCECTTCGGTGKVPSEKQQWSGSELSISVTLVKCFACRGEGRTRDLVATCATPEAIGVALVTLGREGEWKDCPIGILDTAGNEGEKWLVRPWQPSARNISDAGRTLASARKGKT